MSRLRLHALPYSLVCSQVPRGVGDVVLRGVTGSARDERTCSEPEHRPPARSHGSAASGESPNSTHLGYNPDDAGQPVQNLTLPVCLRVELETDPRNGGLASDAPAASGAYTQDDSLLPLLVDAWLLVRATPLAVAGRRCVADVCEWWLLRVGGAANSAAVGGEEIDVDADASGQVSDAMNRLLLHTAALMLHVLTARFGRAPLQAHVHGLAAMLAHCCSDAATHWPLLPLCPRFLLSSVLEASLAQGQGQAQGHEHGQVSRGVHGRAGVEADVEAAASSAVALAAALVCDGVGSGDASPSPDGARRAIAALMRHRCLTQRVAACDKLVLARLRQVAGDGLQRAAERVVEDMLPPVRVCVAIMQRVIGGRGNPPDTSAGPTVITVIGTSELTDRVDASGPTPRASASDDDADTPGDDSQLVRSVKACLQFLTTDASRMHVQRELRRFCTVAGVRLQTGRGARSGATPSGATGSGSPEYAQLRTWLECVRDLPWAAVAKPAPVMAQEDARTMLRASEALLEREHFGMYAVKRRVMEYLAVRAALGSAPAPILCLVGPPGVGKTAVARSLAAALQRPYARIALGGVRDEADIRGHRRTYVGALPGRIITTLRNVRAADPVIVLDEVDKLSRDALRGDPMSALLELLDPEQNREFTDHYLGIPFNMARVTWVLTANTTDTLPAPLLDRLEVVQVDGYSVAEKERIAEQFLVPKQAERHGLASSAFQFDAGVLRHVVELYTREPGVRNLDRCIAALARAVARDRLENGVDASPLSWEYVQRVLDDDFRANDMDADVVDGPAVAAEFGGTVGVSLGLAWSPGGGEVLRIETAAVPGDGAVVLTGKLGDVMQESITTALSLVRRLVASRLIVPAAEFARLQDAHAAEASSGTASLFHGVDVHVHFPSPSAAVGKDGPSAGLAITLALVSLVTGMPLLPMSCFTGEITLTGRVLSVGGVADKLRAAIRAAQAVGRRMRVCLPSGNVRDAARALTPLCRCSTACECASLSEDAAAVEVIAVDNVLHALEAALPTGVLQRSVGYASALIDASGHTDGGYMLAPRPARVVLSGPRL